MNNKEGYFKLCQAENIFPMINKNLTINTRPIKKNAKKYFYDQVGKLKKKNLSRKIC